MTMLNQTNRKLLVGSQKLLNTNNILVEFSKDHDIIQFSYNPNETLEKNTRLLWRHIRMYIASPYQKLTFMGIGQECNLMYELYDKKNLVFDAGVFVNYKDPVDGKVSLQLQKDMSLAGTKIYTYSTYNKKEHPVVISQSHQALPLYSTIRSQRLAKEIYGCVVYGSYCENYLDGPNTKVLV